MSTTKRPPQYNKSSPGVRRILKEAQEIAACPSPEFAAYPLEHDLYEWHFTIRGPPAPSPYAGGFYHGRIMLSPQYPMRPPMFRFLTDSGRFEVNRDICLSISGFHEETWQPSWSIRLALTALRAFMDTDPEGQVGGLDCTPEIRKDLAAKSVSYKCPDCGGGGEEDAMKVSEEEASAASKRDVVPDELRFGYKDQMKSSKNWDNENAESSASDPNASSSVPSETTSAPQLPPAQPQPQPQQQQQQQQQDQQGQAPPAEFVGQPQMFIPLGAPGQNQPVVQGNRPVGGGDLNRIHPPMVGAAMQAPAAQVAAGTSDEDRTNGYIDLAIGLLLSIFIALLLRKV
ncbi:Ubiquitin-conjugating enzyme [Drechslerella dactyloides]|uniref:Ubiquitin-conjugating enzyme n=1 Tax=Drechslerella dactyloides TaxID=74499 RepID=A0AAD6NI72_DREDA|nr:Ubiquitin-conjugating enzyme [Drechslerella dactyloides]